MTIAILAPIDYARDSDVIISMVAYEPDPDSQRSLPVTDENRTSRARNLLLSQRADESSRWKCQKAKLPDGLIGEDLFAAVHVASIRVLCVLPYPS